MRVYEWPRAIGGACGGSKVNDPWRARLSKLLPFRLWGAGYSVVKNGRVRHVELLNEAPPVSSILLTAFGEKVRFVRSSGIAERLVLWRRHVRCEWVWSTLNWH